MIIKKRDGQKQQYNSTKVYDAVILSGAHEDVAAHITSNITASLFEGISVYEIEKLVEDELLKLDTEAAHEYISYRAKRAATRDFTSNLFNSIKGIVKQTNLDALKENGNIDSTTLGSQRALVVSEVAKYVAGNLLPEDVMEAHNSGKIHYHDLSHAPLGAWTNCCLVDVKGMLANGFQLGGASITTPRSGIVALGVIAQLVAQVASAQYGGTSVANIDEVLEPYFWLSYEKHLKAAHAYGIALPETYAKDKTLSEIYDACQAFEYQINSLQSQSQTPFSTISFGATTSWIGQAIQEAILRVRMKGLGKSGVTAIFPKLVFIYDDAINGKPGTPNYHIKQLALQCSAKRMYPDWLSAKNNMSITGASKPITSMGCRSFLSAFKDAEGNEIIDGRNNLGVVTINIPQCAIKANGDIDGFWRELDTSIKIAHKALKTRLDYLADATASLSGILYQEGAFGLRLQPKDKVLPEMVKRGCSISLGFIGLHEAYVALFGEVTDIAHLQQWTLDVAKYLRKHVDKWKTEEGVGYSLYATPSESLSHRLLKIDRKKYGEIPGVTDREYYTNSFHLDVRNKVDPFAKIDFEAPFHWVSSGGHISYVEFPNMRDNLKALEAVVDYAMDKLDYFGVNTPADICLDCHKEVEAKPTSKGYVCPLCGSTNVSAVRRICGYLGPINTRAVNPGKQQEFTLRVKHQN